MLLSTDDFWHGCMSAGSRPRTSRSLLVPSNHIAETLTRYGTPIDKIRVIPYAADCRRFRPQVGSRHGSACTFLFAGGISQRKGIKYLLDAWRRIHRRGWRLNSLVHCLWISDRSNPT